MRTFKYKRTARAFQKSHGGRITGKPGAYHVQKKKKNPRGKKRSKKRAAGHSKRGKHMNVATRKAKTGQWYNGPRGVKVRVRRSKGKFVVDVRP